MDEENEGIEVLASHRGQQLYARMVSWEFSNPDAHQPVSKRKRRKSKKDSQSDEVEQELTTHEDIINNLVKLSADSGTESEDSEYFSAEEILSDSDSDLEESASQMSLQDSENTSAFDSVFESTEASECSESINNSLSPNQHVRVVTRYRAPSKKQKRRRKKFFGDDFCFPFSGLENMDVDFRSLKDDVKLQGEEITVNKQVPSLVELCILSSQKLHNKLISQCLPVNIKKLIRQPIAKIKLQKLHLSWLFRFLSHCEPQSVYEKQFLYDIFDRWKKTSVWKHLCPVGNVFSSRMFLKNCNSDQYIKGNVVSAYVPFHCTLYTRNSTFDFPFTTDVIFLVEKYYSTLYLHSAVAMVINLMLPPSLQSSKKQSGQSETEVFDKILLKSLTSVKYAMKQRFPTATERVFDKVLPYVLWARGDFTSAVQEFLNLAEKETRNRHCAAYLYEIGRMNLHFQEPEVAIMYFRRAADAALQKQKNQKPQLVEEVGLQTSLLIADAYDQGMLTTVKAHQAASAWQQAVMSPGSNRFVGIGIFAVDSLLCFHGFSGKDDVVGWLDDVIRRLEEISSVHDVYLYLSMVHAWKGDEQSSADAYKTFVHLSFSGDIDKAPGQSLKGLYKPTQRIMFKPWQKLADMVMKNKPPKPLQVLWRTRLLPANFGKKNLKVGRYSWDADVRGKNLYLYVNNDGYLTGDLQMLLPPITQVQLDLYSGLIRFPSVSGSGFFHPNLNCGTGTHLLPVPMELYRDKYGNTVHQVAASLDEILNEDYVKPGSTHQFLIWTAADGKRTQINLTTKAKDAIYKDVERKLELKKTCGDMKVVNRSLEILKKCYNKNMNMISDDIYRFAYNEVHPKVETKKYRVQKVKIKKKTAGYSSKPFVAYGNCGILISSHTLVVPVSCNSREKVTVMLFVDCSSKETFAQPKAVLHPGLPEFSSLYFRGNIQLPLPLYEEFQFPYADLCSVYSPTNRKHVIYDTMGEVFDGVGEEILDEAIYDHYPLIIKNCAIYINAERRITSSCNGNISVAEFFGTVYRIDTCAYVLLMATENGVKFADGVNLLPLNINIAEDPEPSLPDLLVDKDSAVHFGVIGQKDLENKPCKLAAIAYENNLIMAEIPCSNEPESIEITLCIELLGHARDVCFLSHHAGFLLSVTQHCMSFEWYREHLYQYSYQGNILGILPCLGPGPRSFCPVMLPSNPDSEECNHRDMKWHVYMRDGHGGIICVIPY